MANLQASVVSLLKMVLSWRASLHRISQEMASSGASATAVTNKLDIVKMINSMEMES